jgi:hypothetical protein
LERRGRDGYGCAMTRRFVAAALVAAALVVPSVPAQAETRTVRDGYDGSAPALDVKSGTFRYTERAAVVRVRFEGLNRRRTTLVAKYVRRDGTTVQVATRYAAGRKRVVVHRYDARSYTRVPARHVTARWNFADDVIRVVIGKPLLHGRVASFYAWSQPKGAQEGSPGGRDDLYVARLRRG